MTRINLLLFLYAFTAIICFDFESLTIIPKVFAGLLIVEYFVQTVHLKRAAVKGPFNWGLLTLGYLSLFSLISYTFLAYDLTPESITNIVMVLVLSFVIVRLVDNVKSFDAVLLAIAMGLLFGYVYNVFVPQIDDLGRTGRYAGTLGNSNLFALMINFCISFLLQRYKLYSKFWKNMVLLFIMISAYEILMSGSKMGLLMLLINILYLVFYIRVIKNATALIFTTIVLVLVSGYFISNFMGDNSVAFERFQYLANVFSGKNDIGDSDMLRYNLAVKGFDMWTQRPFLGWGYGSFLYLGGYNYYTHNNMVELLANSGIVGFLLFHAAIIQLVVMAYRSDIHRKDNIICSLYFCMIVVVSSFGIVLFVEKLFWLLYFIMVAYLKMHTVQKTQQQEIPAWTIHQLN